MRRLSLRARLLLGVVLARGARARRRRRRDLHLAALVPARPGRRTLEADHAGAEREGSAAAARAAAPRESSWFGVRAHRRPGPRPQSFVSDRAAAAEAAGGDRSTDPSERARPNRVATSPSRRRAATGATACARRSSRGVPRASCSSPRSLGGVDDTLHRLLLIELLATGGVLAALTALGLWIVRLGLRPLARSSRRRGPSPPATSRGASSIRTRAPRSAGSGSRSTRCSTGSRRRTGGCAASSPTRRTSCARRSPPCAPTPSCSSAAPRAARRTSSGR